MVERQSLLIKFDSDGSLAPQLCEANAPLHVLDHQSARIWCLGELLSYRIDGDTASCLSAVLHDFEAGRLDHTRLNGRFVLIFHNERSQEWEIVTDRVGAMHCYAVWRGDRIAAIGTDLRALAEAASTCQLDWPAIASFCAFGFFLDDRTYYTDVRILLPHSIYRIGPDGALRENRRYWGWNHSPDPRRTYAETIEAYDSLLRQAVGRCTAHGRTILPLSGGLDSRSLAAVMRPGPQSQAYSYGYTPDSIETWIAAQVASTREFSFTAHTITPYLFDRLEEIVTALHGSQDITQARQCSINAWVRSRADALLTGLCGDLWCDQMGLADGLPEGVTITAHTLRKFLKRGRGWLFSNLCVPHLAGQDPEKTLAERVENGLSEFAHIGDTDFRVKAYKMSRWVFRWSNASLRGSELGATPRIPYYDVDLIDFFCTIPTAFVRDRRLQIDHLKRFAPALARIRWQSADANLYLAPYGRWLSLPRRAVKKAVRKLKGEQPIQRNWEVQFLAPGARARLEGWLLQLTPGFLPADAVQDLLTRFYSQPDAANGYTVSMLLTLAGWMTERPSS